MGPGPFSRGQEAMTVACEKLARLLVAYLVKIVKANLPRSFADNKFEEKAWEIAKVPSSSASV